MELTDSEKNLLDHYSNSLNQQKSKKDSENEEKELIDCFNSRIESFFFDDSNHSNTNIKQEIASESNLNSENNVFEKNPNTDFFKNKKMEKILNFSNVLTASNNFKYTDKILDLVETKYSDRYYTSSLSPDSNDTCSSNPIEFYFRDWQTNNSSRALSNYNFQNIQSPSTETTDSSFASINTDVRFNQRNNFMPSNSNCFNNIYDYYSNNLNINNSFDLNSLFNRSWRNNFSSISSCDKIIRQARLHRSAAIFSEAKYKWNGVLPVKRYKNPVFSTKVFLGGVPWDIGDKGLISSFSLFGNIKTQWPGKEVRCTANGSPQRAGYVYVVFENEKQVKSLLQSCNYDFRNGVDKWYFNISSKRMRYKEVEVVPWIVENSTYVKNSSQRLDPKKTVFVGALHGMITAPALAKIMNEIFDNVIYVNIDVDKFSYPLGCAKICFSCPESYKKAVSAGFLEIKTNKFKKKIQMDPFLENSVCSLCQLQLGPIFCRDLVCFRYFCSSCFNWIHSTEKFKSHCPIMRSKRLLKDYLRELPDPLFTKALFEMMVDGLTVCLPDDRAGNAKLMFSILECLPKSDRCTVLFLMDHLKAIIRNSDRNKMTSQSIAVIFGPIFTCTSEDSSILHQTVQVFKFLLDVWPNKKEEITISDALESKKNYSFSNLISPTSNMKSSLNESSLNNTYDTFSYLNKTNDKLNLDSKTNINDKRKLSTEIFSEKHLYSSEKIDNENKLDKGFKFTDSILKKPSDNLDYKSLSLSSNSHSSSNLNSLSGYQKPFSYHLPNHELSFNTTTTNKFSTTYSSPLKNSDSNNFKTNKILSSSYLNKIDDNDNEIFNSTKIENRRNLPSSEGLSNYQSISYSQNSNKLDSIMKNKLNDNTTSLSNHDYLSNFSDDKLRIDSSKKISNIRSTKSSLIGDISKNIDDLNYD